MFKYLTNSVNKLRSRGSDSFGFSLVELIVAMSILMIIMPSTVGIAKAATSYKNQAVQSNTNLVNSSAFNTLFRGDIENSVAIDLVSNSQIKLKIMKQSTSGSVSYVCKDWAVQGGILKSKKSDGAVSISTFNSDWSDIFYGAEVKAGESGKIFAYENGSVTYDIKLGKDKMINNYTATITPRAAPVSASPCW